MYKFEVYGTQALGPRESWLGCKPTLSNKARTIGGNAV